MWWLVSLDRCQAITWTNDDPDLYISNSRPQWVKPWLILPDSNLVIKIIRDNFCCGQMAILLLVFCKCQTITGTADYFLNYTDGLVQDSSISSALALEILQSYTKLLISWLKYKLKYQYSARLSINVWCAISIYGQFKDERVWHFVQFPDIVMADGFVL